MIKLSEITILDVIHPNIFINKDKVDVIDIVVSIDYRVGVDDEAIEEYYLDKYNLNQDYLKSEFPAYLMVILNEDDYKRIDELSYDSLCCELKSDMCPEIEDNDFTISQAQQEILIKVISKYLKSDAFSKELDSAFDYKKRILASNK